jgi:hypothetical protein
VVAVVDHIQFVILQLQFWDRLKLLLSEAEGLVARQLQLIRQTEPLALLEEILPLEIGYKCREAEPLRLQQPQVDLLGLLQVPAPCSKALTDLREAQVQEFLVVGQI